MPTVTRTAKAVERAYSILEIKELKDGERVIKGTATTPRPDRVGDIVEPLGVNYRNPLPLLHQHNHDAPVGTVTFDKPTKNGITFTAKLAKVDEPGPLRDRIEMAWGELKAGLVRAVSIGFKTIEHAVMDNGGWRFLETEVLELSLVTVPANADCTITSIKSIDRELRAASGKSQSRVTTTARVGASHKKRSTTGETPMTTISERISALEADEANLKAQIKKFDVENLDAEQEERFDELEADLASTTKALKRLRVQEGTDSDKATPVNKDVKSADGAAKSRNGSGNYGRTTTSGPNKNIPKDIPFARAVLCKAYARLEGGDPVALAERNYPDDKRIANYLQSKAAVPAAYTGDGGGWAEDIAEAQTIGTDFIDALRPETILDRMTGTRRVPFNVKVPRFATGQVGYWAGENLPIPMTSGVFDTVTMGKTKVGSIAALTKEQIRFSNINAEATIASDLRRAVVAKMDSTLVSTAAASAGVSPAGLLNGLSAIAANGSGAAADIRADLQDLYAPFSAANISRRGTILVTTENLHLALQLTYDNGLRAFPDISMDGGNALGWPVMASNHCGIGDVIMIAQNEILVADDGEVEVSITDQASLEMLDASLVQDGTAGTGTSVVSLWQLGLVGIKIERFVNWQKARAASVAYIGAAGWNGVATA